jgi:phosphatidate cytidylyltransferase
MLTLLLILTSQHSVVKPLLVVAISLVGLLGVKEYYHAVRQLNWNPVESLGIVATIGYIIAIFATTQNPSLAPLPFTIVVLYALLLFGHFMAKGEAPIENLAITTFGVAYVAIPLAAILGINFAESDGRYWVLYLILVSKGTDIAAYFCGKRYGKRPLAPLLSPKKTVEGAVAGTAAALIISVSFSTMPYSESAAPLSIWTSIWLGLLLAVFSQLGDLSESVLKRATGVKDSSDIPGLGGVLDILDSLTFTSPILYLLLQWHIL